MSSKGGWVGMELFFKFTKGGTLLDYTISKDLRGWLGGGGTFFKFIKGGDIFIIIEIRFLNVLRVF